MIVEITQKEYKNLRAVKNECGAANYRLFIEDGKYFKEYTSEQEHQIVVVDSIRARREKECFSVINRGQLWYASLTSEQIADLEQWYADWLLAPQTMLIPDKPSWLGDK